MTVIVCYCGLSVMRSRCWYIVMHGRYIVMHGRCMMVHSGLRHVTVSVEVSRLVIVATSVGHEYLGMIVEEMASVIVGVHCEGPTTCMPSHRTIEVSEAHVLVELPAV